MVALPASLVAAAGCFLLFEVSVIGHRRRKKQLEASRLRRRRDRRLHLEAGQPAGPMVTAAAMLGDVLNPIASAPRV